MTSAVPQTHDPAGRRPLRLWPGVAALVLQWLAFVIPFFIPGGFPYALLGGAIGGLLIVLWWLFLSRAPWLERAGAAVLMVAAVFATKRVVHASVANAGMGMLMFITAIPFLSLALVASAAASRRLSSGARRASIVAAILMACGLFALVRTGGITGDGISDLHWRWTPTPEELLLAQEGERPPPLAPPAVTQPSVGQSADGALQSPAAPQPAAPAAKAPEMRREAMGTETAALPPPPSEPAAEPDWPGFRGPARDGVVHGVRIGTDWTTSPPVELWRRSIGPGWSSFAIHGGLAYTQEQRGDDELVSCYRLGNGEPVWSHRDPVRFWESNGGAGPRATPSVRDGRVYALGATGIVNALDAGTGAVLWSRNAGTDTGVETPGWGFAGSPLAVGDAVVVAASGRLVAYEARTGDLNWLGPPEGAGYSSPHLVTIDGIPQILLLRGSRSTSVAPADGSLIWEHRWQPGVGIVQPAVTADGDVLIAGNDGMAGVGIRRVSVAHGPDGWTLEERWTSRGLKPYFNDFVVHRDHAFGFDGSILSCIDLADGARKWKGGRYGHGQLVLLPDQDLLLVLSEQGGLALVAATPDQFREIARLPAMEGKTWNHPVLVGDVLLVRNGQEMVAFRLPLADR